MMAVLPCPLASPLFPWLSRYSSRHFIARFRHQSRLVLDYHKTHYVRSDGVLHIDDGWYDLLLSAGKLDSLCDILSPNALEDPEKAKTVVDCQAEYPWVRCEVNDETLRASCAKLEDGQALLICSRVSASPENLCLHLMTDSGLLLTLLSVNLSDTAVEVIARRRPRILALAQAQLVLTQPSLRSTPRTRSSSEGGLEGSQAALREAVVVGHPRDRREDSPSDHSRPRSSSHFERAPLRAVHDP